MRRMSSVPVAALLLLSTGAVAYELLNPPRRWFPADLPRVITVDTGGMTGIVGPDPSKGVDAAVEAVNAWNPGGANGAIVSGVAGPAAISLGDGHSNLIFDDPFSVCTGFCLAATFTGFYSNSQTGVCDYGGGNGSLSCVAITDADIVFNKKLPARLGWTSSKEDPNEASCSNEIYLDSVVTHEVGHLIGLAHSENGAALMAPTVSACDNKGLHADDINGRNALYSCQGGFTETGGGACTVTETPEVSCSDGTDNDCDGQIDAADPDCNSGGGTGTGETGKKLCTNGIDDDGDGAIDCADTECAGSGFCK